MFVYISYSHHDKAAADQIASRLKEDGHTVWIDSIRLHPGDNFVEKMQEGLNQADVLVVLVSESSLSSQWVRQEFSMMALQQISNRERKIIPVKLDASPVPEYLAARIYIDFSRNFRAGLEELSATLKNVDPDALERSSRDKHVSKASTRALQIQGLREAQRRGGLTLVCGAGISAEAGIPTWDNLLIRLLEAMMEKISNEKEIALDKTAATEFHQRNRASTLILAKYLKNNLGTDFRSRTRDILYASQAGSSSIIKSIVALSRPQRDSRPLDSIITFNFDCLIEEALTQADIPNRPVFSEAIRHAPHEIPVYHVHGYLPRNGPIPDETELVFSEDAYHSQFIDPFSWSNLIQLNRLTQNTCLFVGVSLTDPNLRRLLDVAWRKNPDKRLSHYIIKRTPNHSSGDLVDQVTKFLEEQDANALGLSVIWVTDFTEIPGILNDVAKHEET